MQTTAEPLKDLFKTDVRFVVPRFQRRYVWTKENWEALWADVIGAVERYVDTDEVPTHFLGAVVLTDQTRPGASTTKVRQVIDGQQRLATLQLFFAAARDVAAERGLPPRYVESLRKLTHNDDEMSDDPDDVFKVWPTNDDWMAFRQAMTAGAASAGAPKAGPASAGPTKASARRADRPTIVQAYLYFVDQMRAWTATFTAAELAGAFERLITVFNTGMYAVVISLDPSDNPQVIFESLNARGLPLQASDLVRNHLFYTAEARALPAEKLYDEHWARFDDGFWREEVGRGLSSRPRMDAFLGHFLTMELRKEVHSQQLFVTFRDYLRRTPLRLPEVMARFAAYGDIYQSLDTGDGLDAYERGFVKRLGTLETTVVMPVLLRVFGDWDEENRRPVLSALDSYLVRRLILGLPTKSYHQLMFQLLKRLDEAGHEPGTATVGFLASRTAQSYFWPSDRDLARAVTTSPLYRQMEPSRLRLVLGLIDSHLRSARTEAVEYDLGQLTVEHLMPQSWQQHWPLTSAGEAARAKLLHTLGNLTLTTGELNHSVGNGPWRTKRREILDHSVLSLNRSLPPTWDEKAIEARGAQFAQILCRALPRPPATADAQERPDRPAPPDPELAESELAESELAGSELAGSELVEPLDDESEAPNGRQRHGAIARHILAVLSARPQGTVMTVSQLARAASPEYDPNRPNPATIRDRLRKGTVSGVETTTNEHGHLAARLARRKTRANRMPEATAILRAPSGGTEITALEASFHFEMVRLYSRARDEENYDASQFLRRIKECGGVAAARQMLAGNGVSVGFRRLAELGRLDLTVESLVVKEQFSSLFTKEERARARERLASR